jgi:hypothetical protein
MKGEVDVTDGSHTTKPGERRMCLVRMHCGRCPSPGLCCTNNHSHADRASLIPEDNTLEYTLSHNRVAVLASVVVLVVAWSEAHVILFLLQADGSYSPY